MVKMHKCFDMRGERLSVDYFAVLGVPRNATTEDIKRAYREKARAYHPDINQSPDAADRFREIVEAYEVLSDEDQRKAYILAQIEQQKKVKSTPSAWQLRQEQKTPEI